MMVLELNFPFACHLEGRIQAAGIQFKEDSSTLNSDICSIGAHSKRSYMRFCCSWRTLSQQVGRSLGYSSSDLV